MAKVSSAAIALIFLALPSIALAQGVPGSFKELVNLIVKLLNTATGVLVAAALVAFLYGAAINTYRSGQGEHGASALRTFLLWGVAILFVMVSVWGILRLLQQTLFDASGNAQGIEQADMRGL